MPALAASTPPPPPPPPASLLVLCRYCRDDIVGMVLEAIRNDSWQGVYNATAPNPVGAGELSCVWGKC